MSVPTGGIGMIPPHWERKKLKYVASLRSGDSITSDSITESGEYAVFGGNGIRGYTSAYTYCGNYVLIGRQGALCGNINYASGCFWASEHAVVVDIKGKGEVAWLGELLRSMNLNQYSQSAAQPGIAVDVIANLEIPVPPPHEQRAIANYLDRETARLDALVEAKERLLELLAEKRRALITRAVTRGLNADAPMRDSGIDWLGEIPAHWGISKFSRRVFIIEGQVDPEVEPYCNMLLIAPNHIESRTGNLIGSETAAEQGAMSGKYLCQVGDVIYSKIRPALRKATLALEECLCSADMYPLRVRKGLDAEYLLYFLLSEPFSAWAILESYRVAMPKINREALNDFRLPIPPLDEQRAIVSHVATETTKLDALREATERTIALLKERRAALIAAAVTGKVAIPTDD